MRSRKLVSFSVYVWEMKPGNLNNRLAVITAKRVIILSGSVQLSACLCVPVI